jgi:hypothetical protein
MLLGPALYSREMLNTFKIQMFDWDSLAVNIVDEEFSTIH